MLTLELPQALQEEFEKTARLLHDQDSVRQALVEAIELWLAQQHQKLAQTEATANNETYDKLRPELEQQYPGKWIMIAHEVLQGVANTPDELSHLAPDAHHRIVVQVGQNRPQEVELGWQTTFA